ncbi:MAG: hypothetical protein J0M29_13405 [Chitinophagales bacterium]|nr:hypothetical protein [Chitinophagales bacterium]
MKYLFALLLCGLLFHACPNNGPNQLKHDPRYTHAYFCQMDCEKSKMYEKAGKCPVCHVELKQKEVKVEDLNRLIDSTAHK